MDIAELIQISHVLLGIQVLAGFGIALSGLYGINDTFRKGNSLPSTEGGQRILLFTFVMLSGGYLIASSIGSERPPRCENQDSDPGNQKYEEECF